MNTRQNYSKTTILIIAYCFAFGCNGNVSPGANNISTPAMTSIRLNERQLRVLMDNQIKHGITYTILCSVSSGVLVTRIDPNIDPKSIPQKIHPLVQSQDEDLLLLDFTGNLRSVQEVPQEVLNSAKQFVLKKYMEK